MYTDTSTAPAHHRATAATSDSRPLHTRSRLESAPSSECISAISDVAYNTTGRRQNMMMMVKKRKRKKKRKKKEEKRNKFKGHVESYHSLQPKD